MTITYAKDKVKNIIKTHIQNQVVLLDKKKLVAMKKKDVIIFKLTKIFSTEFMFSTEAMNTANFPITEHIKGETETCDSDITTFTKDII